MHRISHPHFSYPVHMLGYRVAHEGNTDLPCPLVLPVYHVDKVSCACRGLCDVYFWIIFFIPLSLSLSFSLFLSFSLSFSLSLSLFLSISLSLRFLSMLQRHPKGHGRSVMSVTGLPLSISVPLSLFSATRILMARLSLP